MESTSKVEKVWNLFQEFFFSRFGTILVIYLFILLFCSLKMLNEPKNWFRCVINVAFKMYKLRKCVVGTQM